MVVSAAMCAALLSAHAGADEPVKAQPKTPAKAEASKPPPAPPVDEAFLEFLADWDSEDESWSEYLASLAKDGKAKEAAGKEPVKPARAGKQ